MSRILDALKAAERERAGSACTSSAELIELKVCSGGQKGAVVRSSRDSVLLGRGGPADLAFDPWVDSVVSGHHAEIRRESRGFFLYDMGSLNGTFLNGEPVRRASLSRGDEIWLGRTGPRVAFSVAGSASIAARVIPAAGHDDREGDARRDPRFTLLLWAVLAALLVVILLQIARH